MNFLIKIKLLFLLNSSQIFHIFFNSYRYPFILDILFLIVLCKHFHNDIKKLNIDFMYLNKRKYIMQSSLKFI